jgi:ATP-binding cassette subfamily F protein 3
VALEGGELHSYVGGWPEYVRVREERLAAGETLARRPEPPRERGPATAPTGAKRKSGDKNGKPRAAGPSKNRLREQEKAERAVEEAEAALAEVQRELADPAAWATKYEAAKSEARHTAARRAVEAAYERLEALV